MKGIVVEGVQKVVGQSTVLDLESLRVEPGATAALVGPPGCGKEVLLELLVGRSRPTLGSLSVAGVDPATDHDTFSRRVGVLFAEDALYPRRSALGNLIFYARLRGLSRSQAEKILAEVGLADQGPARTDRLAAGMQRRLAFGCAVLHDPPVLLLCEPFARCDDASRTLLDRLVRQRAADGTAVLLFGDEAHALADLSDVVYVLNRGRLVESYSPERTVELSLPFKIPVKMEDKVALVNPGDVLYAAAEEGRAILQTATERIPTPFTLTELERRLARSGFFRAHRSYLVNLQHVKEVIPYTRNAYSLVLDDATRTEIPLSKASAAELRELLDY